MAVQIANPEVVKKIEWLATTLNTSKTAAVERALDAFKLNLVIPDLETTKLREREAFKQRMLAILAEFDKLPVDPSAGNDLEWDENGLPV